MNPAFALLTIAALAISPAAGVAFPSSVRKVTSTRTGKPAAPVDITATLEAGRAQLDVKFVVAATSVEVRVHGVDGLTVTSAPVPITGSFTKGESSKTVVTFTAPAGQSNLVVTVRGVFNGSRSAKTATFTIGRPTPAQIQKASAGVKVERGGDRVKEMPARVK